MSLSTRLIAAMVLMVLLTAGTVAGLGYHNIEAAALPRALDRLDTHGRLLALELEASVRGARGDVLGFRSAVAVDGIVRSSLAPGGAPPDAITAQQWRDRLAQRFMAELAAKPDYAQFRIIGVADGGREILRVDRGGPGGVIRVVPDGELQRRGDRDFFKRAVALAPGAVDVSPVELNRQENGEVVTPHMPVIRAAASIQAPDGTPFGIVVINVDLRPAFARILAPASIGGERFVINDRGDYLAHRDPARAFGFEFGKPVRAQDDLPGIAALLAADTVPAAIVRDRSGEKIGLAAASVRLAGETRVTVISTAPYEELLATTKAIRDSLLVAGVAAVLAAVALAIWLGRSLGRPLTQMTRAVEGFAAGRAMDVPTSAGGEIGVLARAFARMTADVNEKTQALTAEVDLRRNITDAALDAFIQIDSAGAVVEWNPQAEAIFGWTRAEAMGQTLARLIVPEEQRAAHAAGIARFHATGEGPILGRRVEMDAQRRDGRKLRVELTVSAVRHGDQHRFTGFIRDLTEKIVAEERLRQAQKLESIGQLTGGVAHDFNNILTVITGSADLLAPALSGRPVELADANRILKAAERGAELTRRLLAVARRQPLQPRRTDVNLLVRDATELLRASLGEQIEIELVLDPNVPPALIDPGELTPALLNLAVNARDAMQGAGRLTIETQNAALDEAYAQANADLRPGNYVLVAVSDTGSGMPPAIRERVFEPFFTTKGPGKGTGLGLSMVYGFIKQSNGHVKIYSEEGHGTTVKLYLPRGDGLAESAVVPIAAPVAGGRERIMVVEDDAMVRKVVVQQLESLGYAVTVAENGAHALAQTEQGAAYDLLFTDVIMPGGVTGRQLADAVVKLRPGVKVLYTSGYTENAIVHHGRLDAGIALLNKPYRKMDLAKKVRAVLDGAGSTA